MAADPRFPEPSWQKTLDGLHVKGKKIDQNSAGNAAIVPKSMYHHALTVL